MENRLVVSVEKVDGSFAEHQVCVTFVIGCPGVTLYTARTATKTVADKLARRLSRVGLSAFVAHSHDKQNTMDRLLHIALLGERSECMFWPSDRLRRQYRVRYP